MKPSIIEKIERNSTPEPNSGCWLWLATVTSEGYGSVYYRGRNMGAHRASYLAYRGEIGTLHVCHHCDVRGCVNPDHLFLGTNLDNMRDRDRKGRMPVIRGEEHGGAKLTAEQVRLIRNSSLGVKPSARAFGVSPKTIRRVRNREGWAHIKTTSAEEKS